MVIILVGADCTGKSTLFNQLKTEYADQKDFHFIKESYTDYDSVKLRRADDIRRYCSYKSVYFFDRATIIDDFIYCPILDKKKTILSTIEDEISTILKNCKIVYLDAPEKIIGERLNNRGDEYITAKDISIILEKYKKVFSRLKIEPIVIDAGKTPEVTLAQFKEKINLEELDEKPENCGNSTS